MATAGQATGHTNRDEVSSPQTDALLQNIGLPSIQEPANTAADPNAAIEPVTASRTAGIQQQLQQLMEQVNLLDREVSSVAKARAANPPCGISAVPSDAFRKITPSDWMRDQYLIYHYCSVTSLTLTDDASIQALYLPPGERAVLISQGMPDAWPVSHICSPSCLHEHSIMAMQHQAAVLILLTADLHNIKQPNCHIYLLNATIVHMMSNFLIHDQHPATLIILAHFAVLVHPFEKDRS
ncbi:hypothetical protein BP5796_10828 [Coleophoma crateriformis]|uniref:Uncharacterized protein n=1 Tax=Coleophoma crateriformis TaxID=565419 RepID=A0A3D8QL26_9HELO|nr:hypothetical protein BP5796_10828 [Coleophoma crateriformis]